MEKQLDPHGHTETRSRKEVEVSHNEGEAEKGRELIEVDGLATLKNRKGVDHYLDKPAPLQRDPRKNTKQGRNKQRDETQTTREERDREISNT
jgi:hypothetical protein